jgi:mono/diheme cytochrome c family protein
VALALLLCACEKANEAGPAIPVDPAALYAQNCARCHGADGKGDAQMKQTMPTIRDFGDPEFRARASTEEIARVIMAGKNQMPSFGGAFSMPKLQSLAGYVRRLGAAPR